MTNLDTQAGFIAALLFFTIATLALFLRFYTPRLLAEWPLAPWILFALLEAIAILSELAPRPTCIAWGVEGAGYGALVLFSLELHRKRGELWLYPLIGLPCLLCYLTPMSVWPIWTRAISAPLGGGIAAFALYRCYETLNARWEPILYLPVWTMITAFLLLAVLPPLSLRLPAVMPTGMVVIAALLLIGFALWGYRRQHHATTWLDEVERAQLLAADRERIGRELHDGVIQTIYAAGLMVEGAKYEMDKNPQQAMMHLDQVTETLDATIREIRHYIFDLRGEVSGEALVPDLHHLLQEFEANTYLRTRLEVINEPLGPLQRERRHHLHQIVREALSNVARHAHAQSVVVSIIYSDDGIDLHIVDDGVGMERIPIHKGYGLRNIRERVRLLDGTLKIESAPGQGVTLHISVPYG